MRKISIKKLMKIVNHKSRKLSIIFNMLLLLMISNLFILNSSKTIKTKNSLNYEENNQDDNPISFSTILHETEKKLKNMQFNRPSDEVLQQRLNFEEFIKQRSVVNYDQYTNNTTSTRLNSFLGIKTKTLTNLKKIKKFSLREQPEIFFDEDYEKHIIKIPCTGKGENPWSSSYFAMRYGLIGVRYDRTSRNTMGKWDPEKEDYSYKYTYEVSKSKYSQPAEYNRVITDAKNKEDIEKYIDETCSPAEKWDICFGDTSFTLTGWMRWKADQHETDGDIPEWYGICHGWAPASYYFKRPIKPVILTCAGGNKIKFLPDDIKALASQFFANADYKTRFMGQSCPFSNPEKIEKDRSTGLYTDPRCSSIDPGAFIILLGNQMGIRKKNFVIDPLPDGEVWNQPIESYEIKWYNLIDEHDYKIVSDNIINLKKISRTKNKFLRFVYKDAPYESKYVIGAFIDVIYAVETKAVKSDISEENKTEKGEFIAAVYLDSNYNIIGGKWKFNVHPNFAWKYEEEVPPKGTYDDEVPNFNGSIEDILKIAPIVRQASLEGQPLLKVIQYLIDESNIGVDNEQFKKDDWAEIDNDNIEGEN